MKSTIDVFVNLGLFGFLQRMHVEILHVQLEKDGMVLDAWIFHALQILILMELNVFALILLIIVFLGKFSMVSNVFIPKTHARKEQDGILQP